jgi:hypothetical protein
MAVGSHSLLLIFQALLLLNLSAKHCVQATVQKDVLTKELSCSDKHCCAILYSDELKCWGSNLGGALGLGISVDDQNPTIVGTGPGQMGNDLDAVNLPNGNFAKKVAVGEQNTCIILNNGKIVCWGKLITSTEMRSMMGQSYEAPIFEIVGDSPEEMASLVPVALGGDYKAIGIYTAHTYINQYWCAILQDKTVKCWGSNSNGRLGLSSNTARLFSHGPNKFTELTAIDFGTNTDGTKKTVSSISLSDKHACALMDNGEVRCWGENNQGQTGLDVTTFSSAVYHLPTNPSVQLPTSSRVSSVACTSQSTCALFENGRVACWGYNDNYSILRYNSANYQFIRQSNVENILFKGGSWVLAGYPVDTAIAQIAFTSVLGPSTSVVKKLFASPNGMCVIQDEEGKDVTRCWGTTVASMAYTTASVIVAVEPAQSVRAAKSIIARSSLVCVVLSDNQIKCIGGDSDGILGQGDTTIRGLSQLSTVPDIELGTQECSDTSTSVVCKQCPTPTFYLASAGGCVSCPIGGYYINKDTSCTACSAGTTSLPDIFSGGLYPASTCQASPPSPSFSSSYNFSIGATVCYACLPGSYSPSIGSANCSSCQPGYYQNLQAQDECEACPAGTYNPSTASSDISSCQACRKGTYSGAIAQSGENTCQQCPAGYFNFYTGQTSQSNCKECPAGTYSSQDGSTCIPCATGYYSSSSASAQCTAADPGYRTVANTNYWSPECASNDNTCIMASDEKFVLGSTSQTICLAGTYSPGTTDVCTACNPGTFSTATGASSISTCQNCAAGTYAVNSGTVTCTPCGQGYYGTVSGSSSDSTCIQCAAGTYSSLEIATQCQPCGPGRWGNQTARYNINQCFLCPAGTFSTAQIITASTQCVKCSAGYFSSQQGAQNNGTCEECPSGTYSTEPGITIADECIRCQAGKYSTAWAASSPSTCQNCQPGTFSQAIGANNQSYCTVCGFGNWSDVPGATQCKQCDRGTYSNRTGQASNGTCIPCRAGTWSDQIGADAESDCILCGLGKYSITMGAINANTCLDCGTGKYNNVTGAGSELFCRRCPVGTFLDTMGNDNINDCYACPAGMSNNAEGSDDYLDCIKCNPGYFSGSAQSAECLPCDAGYSTTSY